MIRVKICGIARPEDAREVQRLGADFMGLVFAPSPRRVDVTRAKEILNAVPEFRNWVAVFVNEPRESILQTCRTLEISHVQLHGEETPEFCRDLRRGGFEVIKALRVRDKSSLQTARSYPCPFLLLDHFSDESRGGTGHAFDWSCLEGADVPQRMIVSGGLTADNLGALLNRFSPYAVDVSSGVEERPGVKDPAKVRNFVAAVRAADAARKGSHA